MRQGYAAMKYKMSNISHAIQSSIVAPRLANFLRDWATLTYNLAHQAPTDLASHLS